MKYSWVLIEEKSEMDRLVDTYDQLAARPKRKKEKSNKESRVEVKVMLKFCDKCGRRLV